MRVVLDARVAGDHFPGIGRVAVRLSEALVRTCPEVDLFVLRRRSDADHRNGTPAGTPVWCETSPFDVAQQWVVPRRLREVGADAYHSLYYAMPYAPGVPTVLTLYDVIPLVVPGAMGAAGRFWFRRLYEMSLRATQRWVAISDATRRDVADRFGVDRALIGVIPLAADERFRPQDAATVAALRERLKLPARFVLTVSSNKPHKNLEHLVEAWTRARTRPGLEDVGLVCAGPWDDRYPAAKARGGEAVRWLGPVGDDDLPALYAASGVFAFPSRYEGFGLPLLEAMACGTPCVASTGGSLPEVAGDAAVLLPPDDVEAWVDAIARVLTDSAFADTLRAKGFARAREHSWERAAREYAAVYAGLAGSPGARPA